MRETVLTTLLYKYNPYARFIIFLYISAFFLFCLFAFDHIPMYVIWLIVGMGAIPLVYAAISKKTAFNFRAWDNRLLSLSPSCIRIGKDRYDIRMVTIDLQINAYDGFIYRIRRKGLLKPQITYGNNNVLLFQYKGVAYDAEFHLPDYASYVTLCEVLDQWKATSVQVNVTELFTREFMHKQYRRLQRKKR